ncbi:hypothetical protein FCH79_00470 [Pseudomonas koreensis]|uniref:hypothetical protein n=1 Tax=Pseudomonas TaxID=286 RepID=UPI000A3A7C1C|nr:MULTISPECIES: hypothetical protein [Pseudomonas]NTZ93806.1 hypothetical protein [Pseudomonas koreensis]QXZ16391.1 hypothetical protein KVQ82_10905 [Pseudomonas sp. AO-1]
MKKFFIRILAATGIAGIAFTLFASGYLIYLREQPIFIKIAAALIAMLSAFKAYKYLKHAIEHAQGKKDAPKLSTPVFMVTGAVLMFFVTRYLSNNPLI